MFSGIFYFAFSRLAFGLVATIISRQLRHLLWSVAMVSLGALAFQFEGGTFPWNIGPVLVIIGGIVAALIHLR